MIYYTACPHCNQRSRHESEAAFIGSEVTCPECNRSFIVASRGTMATDDPMLDMFIEGRMVVERRRGNRVRRQLMRR